MTCVQYIYILIRFFVETSSRLSVYVYAFLAIYNGVLLLICKFVTRSRLLLEKSRFSLFFHFLLLMYKVEFSQSQYVSSKGKQVGLNGVVIYYFIYCIVLMFYLLSEKSPCQLCRWNSVHDLTYFIILK